MPVKNNVIFNKDVSVDMHTHQLLAEWAAACAEHVLFVFEESNDDERPRNAILAAHKWASGNLKMTEARKFAFAAHAAARNTESEAAIAAARSAGHAAATAHVPGHARYAADYALKAARDKLAELNWQKENLPRQCHSVITFII